jgi:polynucleotide 5'-hydroxyl-kinase GRC3/NOL9
MPIRFHEIDIPSPWQQALDHLCAHPGVIMILGALDTGKSTLTQVTLHALQQTGRTVAWVDCDVGQSDLGPPTTITMTIIKPSTNLEKELRPDAMRFVGSTSPSGHLLPMLVGIHRLVQLARQRGAEAVVINTTGMVHGGPARALNLHLMDLIKPDDILALQAQSEIEHLLRPMEQQQRCRIHRLPLSQKARPWSREARRQIRQEHFCAYFQRAQSRVFDASQLSWQNIFLGSGVRLSAQQIADVSSTLDAEVVYGERCGDGLYLVVQGRFRGYNLYVLEEVFGVGRVYVIPVSDFESRLVGLSDAANDLLALGLLQQIDWANYTLQILTPLSERSLTRVKAIQFGSIRVDRFGVEYPGNRYDN